jgi:DnaJ-domain-containing protein 1
MKGEGLATEQHMRGLYKSLVPRIAERVATMAGRFRWFATDAFANIVPSASAGLLESLLVGVSRSQEKELDPHIAPRRPLRLAPGESWPEVVPLLAQACGSDSLTRAINGRATIAQLLEVSPTPQERLVRARQVFLLMSTMAVRASLEPMTVAMAAAPAVAPAAGAAAVAGPAAVASSPRPTPVDAGVIARPGSRADAGGGGASDAGMTFSADEQSARERIGAMAAQIAGKDHWDVLGIKRGADAAAVKKAFYALSRDFHPDSFAGLKLGSAKAQLDQLFARIQEAYATLSDDNKRGEYEAKLNFEKAGGSSDVAAIFQAESEFNKVKMLVERGEIAGAAKIIDRVVTVLAGNEEARGYKAFLDWWNTKNPATVEKTVKDLSEWYKAHPSAHSLVEFQGWMYLETGDLKRSRMAFKRVLDVEPRHAGANRGMRTVMSRIEEAEKAANSGLRGLLKR